jgi:hypothetical protein
MSLGVEGRDSCVNLCRVEMGWGLLVPCAYPCPWLELIRCSSNVDALPPCSRALRSNVDAAARAPCSLPREFEIVGDLCAVDEEEEEGRGSWPGEEAIRPGRSRGEGERDGNRG